MKKNKALFTSVAGILAGAIASKFANKAINKFLPNANPTMRAIIPVGLGVVLAMQKNEMVKNAGFGMIGAGGVDLASVIVPGIGAPEIPDVFMDGPGDDDNDILQLNGPADQSILSGPADQSILSGPADQSILSAIPTMEEQMYYRLNGEF